ncbi:MAG: MMPL family transporter [Paludibacteraceae bacterium]|nr:MMPL family transporter [Paludibacteraceae bacterium]
MSFKKGYHYLFLLLTLALTVTCVTFIPKVNVNSDMTKYLPDQSRMKHALDIMESEFDMSQMQMTSADVKAMFHHLTPQQERAYADSLQAMEHVQAVSWQTSQDSLHTLYSLVVPKSVDQKGLGFEIRERYGEDIVVETSQDGATPPFSVIVIAAVIILVVLIVMSQSWLDPILFLLSIGMAVVINMGTNAFLPSVSITTDYIGSILQLVLSLDYSIVLMNRFRQELRDDRTPTQSVTIAIQRAYPPILSSALTTVVGLLMLAFMRLKIGMDMGFVLAKGVVCSLLCTFTVLPSLLILFHSALQKTLKRTPVLPTDRLARFATAHKIPMAIFGVGLFVASYFLAQRTEIYFSTNGVSRIAEYFPKSNVIVVLYDTRDEDAVIPLADSLKTIGVVDNIVSYPTLLKQPYTADGLSDYINDLMVDLADYIPEMEEDYTALLTPQLMRTAYYLHTGAGDTLRVSFPDLMRFVLDHCMNEPMFASSISDDMREQIGLLEGMLNDTLHAEAVHDVVLPVKEQPVPVVEPHLSAPAETTAVVAPVAETAADTVVPVAVKPRTDTVPVLLKAPDLPVVPDKVSVIDFMPLVDARIGDDNTHYLVSITDTARLRKPMTVREISEFVGSTVTQTRMVFSFRKGEDKDKETMTPLQYVHLLTDDLFQRKSLSAMVSAKQKRTLTQIAQIMDYADADAQLTPAEMSGLLTRQGVPGMTEDRVRQLAFPAPPVVEETPKVIELPVIDQYIKKVAETPEEPQIPLVYTPQEEPQPVSRSTSPVARKPSAPELIDVLMDPSQVYTADQMASNFHRLGNDIDPHWVNLLYNYYGSWYDYRDSLTMSLEGLLNYVADTLVWDDRFASLLDDGQRGMLAGARGQLAGAVSMMANEHHSLLVVQTTLPDESEETYRFVGRLDSIADHFLQQPYYMLGESVMFSEMKDGFGDEMKLVTLLTILAIFLIVAISFRSVIIPTILIVTIMTAVYVNVIFCGIISDKMLYLAYLIVQSILMGATIDYGILLANYYREKRRTLSELEAMQAAYRGSIRTIMTSGLLMVLGAGAMAMLVDDVAISAIVGCLAIGAFVAILLILVVLPAVLVAFDRWLIRKS